MRRTDDIAVVHLVLKSYPFESFRAFVDSYRYHDAGRDHDLWIALKGFTSDAEAAAHLTLLADVPHRTIAVPDDELDIGSYFHVAQRVESRWLCFLNSRTAITTDGWLDKLVRAAATPGTGAAAATGSLQSISSDALRASARRNGPPGWPGLRQRLAFLRRLPWFPTFPNPHLRTNAFVVDRAVWLSLRRWPFRRRHDTGIFESGRHGMSRQLHRRGLRPVVVDACGRAIPVTDLRGDDDVFWQGTQARLLATDNQTGLYADGDDGTRAYLRALAWEPVR